MTPPDELLPANAWRWVDMKVDVRPMLPAEEPLRILVERWGCWGWPMTKAAYDQPSPWTARESVLRWVNSPDVKPAFIRAITADYRRRGWGTWTDDRGHVPLWQAQERVQVEDKAPPPPTKLEVAATRIKVLPATRTPVSLQSKIIVAAMRGGASMKDVAEVFSLSYSRVHQIWHRAQRREKNGSWVKATPETVWRETEAALQ
jgi:hypothetical protein